MPKTFLLTAFESLRRLHKALTINPKTETATNMPTGQLLAACVDELGNLMMMYLEPSDAVHRSLEIGPT